MLELSVLLRLPNYEFAFRLQKAIAKLLNDAFYAILCREIKKLAWSDPEHPRPGTPSAENRAIYPLRIIVAS